MFTKIKYILRSKLLPDKLFLFNKSSKEKILYLTFDDGPVPGVIEPLLDLLDKYQVKATFFVIGKRVEKYQALTTEIFHRNHQIANHSYTHVNFNRLSSKDKHQEIDKTNQVIKQVTGENCTLFRVPQGRWNIGLLISLLFKKMTAIHWSRDSMDFMKEPASTIIQRFHDQPATAGDIILFHDDNDTCIEVLKTLIPWWQSQGFTFKALEKKQ